MTRNLLTFVGTSIALAPGGCGCHGNDGKAKCLHRKSNLIIKKLNLTTCKDKFSHRENKKMAHSNTNSGETKRWRLKKNQITVEQAESDILYMLPVIKAGFL